MTDSRLSVYTRRVLIAAGAIIGTVAAIYFMWQLARVFMLIFAGVLLAVILSGLTNFVAQRTSLPRGAALAGVVVATIGLFVGFGFLVGPRLTSQVGELAQRIPEAVNQLREQITSQQWAQQILQLAPEPEQMASSGSGSIAGQVFGVFSTFASTMSSALVVVIIGLYLAIRPLTYTEGAARLVPSEQRQRAGQVLAAMGHALRWWMVGRGASMLVVGILTALGLLLAGVPLFLSLGVIAGLFSFVPYIGPIAGAVPAILVAFTVSPVKALYVVLIFAGVQLLESNLITPLIQERTVSIPPALLITAQVVAGVLAGILGVLLATPLAVTLTVAVQMLYVEDVLDEPVEVLGESEEEVVRERAGDEIV
jgi:predicted PurR-regulated permease PerM